LSEQRPSIKGSDEGLLREEIELYYSRACIETEIGHFDASLKYFRRGHEAYQRLGLMNARQPSRMEYALVGGIANSLNGLGRNDESEVEYENCLKLKDENQAFSIYEVNLCRCQWSNGKLDEASTGLENFIRRREEKFGIDDTENFW
jgi:hypothetical protein